MASSSLITDYLGRGALSGRPSHPNIPPGAIAVYYATDTGGYYTYNGSAWVLIGGSAGVLQITIAPAALPSLPQAFSVMYWDGTKVSIAFAGDTAWTVFNLVGS
jgi:hypothetical protein